MGIEQADNFFYFISPHSIISEYCQKELAQALKYNKRIVPFCANAESWRYTAQEENKKPASTILQQDFIQESRKAIEAANKAERRQRNLNLGSVTAGLIIAILSVFAFVQMDIDYANQIVPHCLTPKQRERFFLPEDSKSEALVKEGEILAGEGQIELAFVKFK